MPKILPRLWLYFPQLIPSTTVVALGSSSCKGSACGRQRAVSAPTPTTRARLYVVAHECGHVALQRKGNKPTYLREYEAEIYAHQAMRRHGVAVPRNATIAAKKHIAKLIDVVIRYALKKRLDRAAVHWCASYHLPATKNALERGYVALI